MNEDLRVELAVTEYRTMIYQLREANSQSAMGVCVSDELSRMHDWSPSGADALVALAENYGVFMLRNAFALAVALEKEDGILKF